MNKMKKIRLAVVGSRSIGNYDLVKEKINSIIESLCAEDDCNIHILSGGALGVDSLAIKYAKEKGLHYEEIFPNWGLHGKGAGFVRNAKIAEECDYLLCIWDGKSKGAKHTYDLVKKSDKPAIIYEEKLNE